MTDKRRNRWMVNLLIIVGLVSFIGISVYPLLSMMQSGREGQTVASPSPVQSVSPQANTSELEAQARGYEALLQKEPDNQTALRELVKVKAQMGDAKGAIAPLERLVKLNPETTDYSVLLAQTKQETGDAEGAAQIYRDVLKADPGNVKALDGYAYLLVQQDRADQAVTLLQDTLKSAPQLNQVKPGSVDLVATHLTLGYVYLTQKEYDQAIAVYEEASKIDSKDFRPVLRKAIALREQGKAADAKAAFETAKTLAPAEYKSNIERLAQTPAAAPAPSAKPQTEPKASPPASNPTTEKKE